jgi:hypothetical protein
MKDAAFILRVLQATGFDDCDTIWWRTDGEYAPITFFVNCNDTFWWGTADCEEITPENLPLFEQTLADEKAVTGYHGAIWVGALFAARVRQMRPQGAAYPKEQPGLWPLFDACGPPRQTGFGNPYPSPMAQDSNASALSE